MKIRREKVSGYEGVWFCEDGDSRLRAYIAVHNTSLGPALGGIRMWPFRNKREALQDVLRLAKAMTYKAAVSGLKLGGGKAVIIGDPLRQKSKSLFLAMGDFIDSLRGKYLAAEDSGIVPGDLDLIRKRTPFVTGASHRLGGSGNPSPATAQGIYLGIKAAVKELLDEETLTGLTCAVQGVGQVGSELAKLLVRDGCHLVVTDLVEKRARALKEKLKVRVVSTEEIYSVRADIFSPCALGGTINGQTIRQLKVKIVAGGANNQLANEKEHSELLARKNILYAPDFVINAGGLIRLYVREILKEKDVSRWLVKIYESLRRIFRESRKCRVTPLRIAYELARQQLRDGQIKKSKGRQATEV